MEILNIVELYNLTRKQINECMDIFKKDGLKAALEFRDKCLWETCEICDTSRLKDCISCSLSGEPNPEAFSREDLIKSLNCYYNNGPRKNE